jgi:hypothetical protein
MPSLPWGYPDGSLSLPAGPRSGPTFIIALLVFSQVYNRVISEWSIGLFISISGAMALTIATTPNGRRPS